MKNELQLVCESRLKRVLVKDKGEQIKLIGILKSEIVNVLKNYLELSPNNFEINFILDEDGCYNLEILAEVIRFKNLSAILLD